MTDSYINPNYWNDISKYYDGFPFTHEQAFKIKDILLLNYPLKQVNLFINELRNIAEGAACLLDMPDYKTYKNERKSLVALLEKSHDLLEQIRNPDAKYHKILTRPSNFDALNNNSGADIECLELAVTTGNLLSMLIRKIKSIDDTNIKRFKGRPTADSKGIVSEIVKAWEDCFEQTPSNYAEGPFYDVVKIVLEGLNLPFEFPQRKITQALK